MPHFAEAIGKEFACEVLLFNGVPEIKKRFFAKTVDPKLHFFSAIIEMLKPDDRLLFLEYLGTHEVTYQTELLSDIRKKGYKNYAATLLHLPFRTYTENFAPGYIDSALENTDRIIVYGSSLAQDLNLWGVGSKVTCTFHYADTAFFTASTKKNDAESLNVLIWGNTFRNISYLRYIVQACPEFNFIFCIGRKPYHDLLKYKNVEVYEYIEEIELLELLKKSHINLSVMYDTIGSNVVVISKACGLVNVVSDVGSIRDYCTNEESFLCRDADDFVIALKKLNSDRSILKTKAEKSLFSAQTYSIDKSVKAFQEILLASK